MGIRNPIFVVGNPRSGTTLLRLVLTSHSKINIPPESNFIIRKMKKYKNTIFSSREQVGKFIDELREIPECLSEKWEISFDNFFSYPYLVDHIDAGLSYVDLCAVIYQYYNLEKLGKTKDMWGDKNNANTNYIKLLARLYPDAKFVHIVRDGRAVLSSYKQLENIKKHKYAPDLPTETWRVAARWASTVSRCSFHLDKHARGRYIVIRYEDLITEFESTVSSVCEFLDVDFESDMEKFYLLNKKVDLEPSEYEWKKNTRNPIDKTNISKWKLELSKNDIRDFECLSRKILLRYSYSLQSNSEARKIFFSRQTFIYNYCLIAFRVKEVFRDIKYNIF